MNEMNLLSLRMHHHRAILPLEVREIISVSLLSVQFLSDFNFDALFANKITL